MREQAVTQVAVKSLITSPAAGDGLAVGPHTITGAAWSGGQDIAFVQVSVDGGKTWQLARLLPPQAAYAWRFWEFPWLVTQTGTYTLMARPTRVGPRSPSPTISTSTGSR